MTNTEHTSKLQEESKEQVESFEATQDRGSDEVPQIVDPIEYDYYSACAKPREGVTPTSIGGQAVIEGVMMRGKYSWAVTARDAEGQLHSKEFDLASGAKKNAWMRWPIVRGVVALVESLILGTKALTISAELAGMEEESDEEMPALAIAGSVLLGGLLSVLIFIVLPAFLTNLMVGPATENPIAWNAVDGVLRVFAFFIYIWLISFVPDIRRVFMYHGAEHKTIHTLEHGEELTVENARKYPTLHVRCGTAFLLVVMVMAILVFSLIPVKAIVTSIGLTNKYAVLGVVILSRILFMPLVAGLAYEITVKWAGSRADKKLVKFMLWPGLQLQRMTTIEPDDDMIEIAIASTRLVLARQIKEEQAELLGGQHASSVSQNLVPEG